MQPLMERRAVLRLGNYVNRFCVGIDYRSTHDADIRAKIRTVDIYTRKPRFAAGHQALRPIRLAWRGIGVKSVDSVMYCSRHQNIMRSAADGYVSYPERLRKSRRINGAGKTLAYGSFHSRSVQRIFLAIHTISRQIVVISKNSSQIGDVNSC